MMRPPTVVVDDDAPLRRDVNSDTVRRVYPDLPATADARNAYLAARDQRAYRAIAARFPRLTPPGRASPAPPPRA
jgi:hypothetical protein